MIAVCINVYMIMFNACITALACFDGYIRAATLIADKLITLLFWLLVAVTETWHLCTHSRKKKTYFGNNVLGFDFIKSAKL